MLRTPGEAPRHREREQSVRTPRGPYQRDLKIQCCIPATTRKCAELACSVAIWSGAELGGPSALFVLTVAPRFTERIRHSAQQNMSLTRLSEEAERATRVHGALACGLIVTRDEQDAHAGVDAEQTLLRFFTGQHGHVQIQNDEVRPGCSLRVQIDGAHAVRRFDDLMTCLTQQAGEAASNHLFVVDEQD